MRRTTWNFPLSSFILQMTYEQFSWLEWYCDWVKMAPEILGWLDCLFFFLTFWTLVIHNCLEFVYLSKHIYIFKLTDLFGSSVINWPKGRKKRRKEENISTLSLIFGSGMDFGQCYACLGTSLFFYLWHSFVTVMIYPKWLKGLLIFLDVG